MRVKVGDTVNVLPLKVCREWCARTGAPYMGVNLKVTAVHEDSYGNRRVFFRGYRGYRREEACRVPRSSGVRSPKESIKKQELKVLL